MERKIMTIAALKKLLNHLERKYSSEHQVWLSSDEESNMILPMLAEPQLSVGSDKEEKRIVFYPTEQLP